MMAAPLPAADRCLVVATLWLRIESLKARLRDPTEQAERHLIRDEIASLRRIANAMTGATVTISQAGQQLAA